MFNDETPIELPSSEWNDRSGSEGRLVVAAPVFENGLALLGEENKLVPVSPDRFTNVSASNTTGTARLEVEAIGAAGETVSVLVADTRHVENVLSRVKVKRIVCTVGAQGRVFMISLPKLRKTKRYVKSK